MIPSLGERARQASHTEPTPPAGQGRTKGGGKGDAGGRGGAHAADDPRPTPQAASDGPQASPRTSAARALRQELQIAIEEDPYGDCPVPIASFDEAEGLPRYVMNNLARAGITGPLPIQAQALPLILTGRDVIGLAQTGSGKTLAFLLPIATHIKSWPRGVNTHALVLAPTRELSVQIFDEAQKVFDTRAADWTAKKVFCACVYGGDGRRWQEQQLTKGAHIIVATPGRLIDFIRSGAAVLDQVSYFVLDEADRMLDMGFSGDVASISATLDPGRQMLFFSATWNKQVQELARGLCRKGSQPVRISYGQRGCRETDGGDEKRMAREGIVQEVITVDYPPSRDRWNLQAAEKRRLLNEHVASALAASPEHKVLIFVSQKNVADDLKEELSDDGIAADSMHGGKQQSYRLWVLDQFRKGNLRVLVCTDVLGRGIDIPSVSHVVIHDMGDLQDYIHRIGRTARGKYGRGHALVFFEYWAPMPHLAGELIEVLEESKQPVPEDLRRIADEVLAGERPVERMPWRRVLAAEKAKAAKANQHGWD